MKRIAKATGAAFLLAGALLLAPSLPARKLSADELLTKARNQINPSLAGPHHLLAQVTVLVANKKEAKGTYILDWAAPDRFREEIHLPGYDEVKVALGTTLYRKRNLDYIPARVFQLEELMNPTADLDQFVVDVSKQLHPAGFKATPEDTAAVAQLAVTKAQINNFQAYCISPAMSNPEVCVDEIQGFPLEITQGNAEVDESFEFGDYSMLKEARISRERQFVENGATVIEAQVKKLSAVQQFDPATFKPPADAAQFSWCEDMTPAMRQPLKAPATISPDDFQGPEVMYGLVRRDGSLQRITIVESGGAKADADVRTLANSIRFAPATCAGKPVESETRFMVGAMDFISSTDTGGVPEGGAKGFTTPSCEYCPTPRFPDAAFRRKIAGLVVISAIVGTDGRAHNLKLVKHLGFGFDESAINSVRTMWRFKPATGPDGKPAAVHTLIEVEFNIY